MMIKKLNNLYYIAKQRNKDEWLEGNLVSIDIPITVDDPPYIIDFNGIWPVHKQSIAMNIGLKDNIKWDELTDKEKKAWIDKCELWDWLDVSKPETVWCGKRIFGSIPVDGKMSEGGDILKDSNNNIGKIVFWRGCFTLKYIDKDISEQISNKYIPIYDDFDEFTKIGNQFDNPELLEE